jgi:hypothetical protein
MPSLLKKWRWWQGQPMNWLGFYVWKWCGQWVPDFGFHSSGLKVRISKTIFHNGYGFELKLWGFCAQFCHSGCFCWADKDRTFRVFLGKRMFGF